MRRFDNLCKVNTKGCW